MIEVWGWGWGEMGMSEWGNGSVGIKIRGNRVGWGERVMGSKL